MNDTAKPSLIIRIPTPIWLFLLIIVAYVAGRLFALPAVYVNRPVGIALIILGIATSASGRMTFVRQKAEVFPWSEKHSALVSSGPYRITRNPMYLGLLIIGFGAALLAGTWLMWLVPVTLFVLDNFVIIPFEEASMERACGDAYREYKRKVRRWI